VTTAGSHDHYLSTHDEFEAEQVIDYLLRDENNPSSVRSLVASTRQNARQVRTALTREVWEATNQSWMDLNALLAEPVRQPDLPNVLATIRQESAIVRGAMHGTMTRNDGYDFARLGTFIERADNTARILDVKYYVLLPSPIHVGSRLDNVQWETILRSVSAQRAYRWRPGGETGPSPIAEFIILDPQMPRSLLFCYRKLVSNLTHLKNDYGFAPPCHATALDMVDRLQAHSITSIFDHGLHEFLNDCIIETAALGAQIEKDYRFYD
jgi:uncharacterized alpha-E superfamily protein